MLRIRDVYPGSRILVFTHPGSRIQKQQQKEERKKLVFMLSKIWIWDPVSGIRDPGSAIQDSRSGIRDPGSEIRDQRSGIRDPGSEIRDPENPYSGSRIQGSKRHRIPDPQHCWVLYNKPYVPTFQRKRKEHGRGNAGTIIYVQLGGP